MSDSRPAVGDITAPFDLETLDDGLTTIDNDAERRFGPYLLSYEMAAGGMGTVSLGHMETPDQGLQAVAIKRIHSHLAHDRAFVQMFLDEARIASRIDHPNVCSVIDYGEVGGIYYMAMEYLAGVPLARLAQTVAADPHLRRSQRWHSVISAIVADAAAGLHAAHELADESGALLGVVHRDVSPENVFVTFDGHAKLLDFGIAFARDRLYRTEASSLKGTLGYMAPERFTSNAVDRRTDVWSLGACLWEALAGRHLMGESADLGAYMEAIDQLKAGVPLPSRYCHTVPAALDEVVAAALAWERGARHATARAFGDALRSVTELKPYGPPEITKLLLSLYTVLHEQRAEVYQTILKPEGAPGHGSDGADTTPTEAVTMPKAAPPPATPIPRTVVEERSEPAPPEKSHTLSVPFIVLLAAAALVLILGLGMLIGIVISGDADTDPARDEAREALLSDRSLVLASSSPADDAGPARGPAPGAQPDAAEPVRPERGDSPSAGVAPVVVDAGGDAGRSEAGPTANAGRRQRKQAPPGGVGVVNVVTRGGWADVYEGGRHYGPTPRRLSLSAGRHVLELRPLGKTPGRRVVVNVRRGKTVPVVVNLER